MSTITKEFTNERLEEIGVDGFLNHGESKALASLEAEESGRNPVLAYADSYRDMAKQGIESIPVWSVITDLERNIAPLYTAPTEPVSVPDESAVELLATDLMKRIDNITGERHNLATLSSLRVSIVEACRAAMLHGADGNSPVIPDGWVLVPKEPTSEMLNAAWVSHGIYHASAYRTMLAAAPQQK